MSINIKPSHRGKLTARAKAASESLSAYESSHRNSKNPAIKKEVVFAENAKHFHHPGHHHTSNYKPEHRGGDDAKHTSRMKHEEKTAYSHLKGY